MNSLAEFLNTKLYTHINKGCASGFQYRVKVSSLKSNLILINYLEKYPLFSSKFLNYKDWARVVKMIENKEHLTQAGKDEILIIKSRLNNSRLDKDFDWSHLSKFYTVYTDLN